MGKTRYIIALFAVLGATAVFGQQRTTLAGLEGHVEYRRLVDEERSLVRLSDSLSRSMTELRRDFRTDTLNRAANSAALLTMEEASFDLRGRMAHLAERINAIEQEWILANLHSGDETGGEGTVDDVWEDSPELMPANLVYSSFFERELKPAELVELRKAQVAERETEALVAACRENIEQMRTLAAEYDRAATEAEANKIKERFDALAGTLGELDRRTGESWVMIFDSKSYIYNLIAEKRGYDDMLEEWTRGLDRMREQQLGAQGRVASLSVADYYIQKPLLLAYETALAEAIGNRAALDSLKPAAKAFPGNTILETLAPVRFRERSFIEYGDIKGGRSTLYSARNPIPEVRVYPRGIVWRVLLGTFSAAQSPSVFRNMTPLAVEKGADGKYRYFAGGFRTEDEATAAVEKMRRAGFRKPEVVVWMDGVYFNPAAEDAGGHEDFYRLELSGVKELSSAMMSAVKSASAGAEVVHGAEGPVITPLAGRAARALRISLEAAAGADGAMSIKIVAIPR
jgi:hypothetical protein